MKICFVGGAQSIHIKRWVTWFTKHGHDVHLISVAHNKFDGVKVHRIGDERKKGTLLNFFRKMFQTRKIIRKIQPDILHAHYIFGYGDFAAFANYHPFIVSVWGTDISAEPQKSFFKKLLVKYALKKADIIHVWDEHSKGRLEELNVNSDKTLIKPWSIDFNFFNPGKHSDELRKKLDIQRYMVICTRQWSDKYNIERLIHAIPNVVKNLSGVTFVFIGGGPLEDKIKKICKNLGIMDKVKFIGKIPYSEMPTYISSADLLVDTRSPKVAGGGIGIANLEAMASGVPILLSERGYLSKKGMKLSDEDWFFGEVYNPDKNEDLSNKMVSLLKDKRKREDIINNQLKSLQKIGDWDEKMEFWEGEYKKILGINNKKIS
jgi:glycosyltransferase involved in cell wall biosynthesis